MKCYNYTDLGIVSSDVVKSHHLLIEGQGTYAGNLYMVPTGVDDHQVWKSTDKGDNWSIVSSVGTSVTDAFYDQANDAIWWQNDVADHRIHDLSDDSITSEGGAAYDVGLGGFKTDVYHRIGLKTVGGNCVLFIGEWTDPGWHTHVNGHDFGVIGVRTYNGSRVTVDGTYGWFLFKWSDEDVELWRWQYDAVVAVEMESFPNTELSGFEKGSIAYDGNDILYFILQDTGDSKYYLWSYVISTDTATKLGEHNVILMRDDRPATGIKEKAFHEQEYKIYQIQENKHQLNLISVPETDAVIVALTDNFFMNSDGDMFELQDVINLIHTLVIDHQIQESSHAIFTLTRDTIPIEKNIKFIFYHEYTTAGATSEEIIFEGIVFDFTERSAQTVWLVSPAKREIKNTKPSGDFTVDSDGLISSIISTYFNYITAGTLTDGADLGTAALGGDQIAETIFDGCGQFEGFIWYLTPTGKLYFNNGTVDSTINYTEASGSGLRAVDPSHVHAEYNRIKVRGAYVGGVRVESDWQEDLESQQSIGINERIFTISFLNTTALCNTAGANILTILAKDPKKVKFLIRDTTAGYIQVGETITFECTLMDITIASDQYLIQSATINKYGEIVYTITDELT